MKLNTVVSDGLKSGEEIISIKSLLNHLGFSPVESNEKESFYSNIFISNSLKPKSFKLDHALDVWFDKSIGKGGNIIDFGKLYWPNLEVHALHEKLSSFSEKKEFHYMFPVNEKPRRKRRPVKLPHYQIERIRQLGITSEVSAFLQEAGLWEIADSNLVEVHYYVRDEKGKRRDFCAAGWPNENGGWEVYAKNFKSCIGSKGMSIFQASTRNITIFQEFTDYLKNRDKLYALYSSILVLNYPQFLSAAIKRVSKYKNITFYIDEKREGYEEAKLQIQSTLQNCIIQPL
ncbi:MULTISPECIES: hypothetical protein [Sphingobacterium]|uniref:hypothetical protein n=1 Tax=Sphingobacterium TaxID=28453 RepID=UPI00257C40DF|nr:MULTISPECIES: hypothetical protein [Sphingobacterium]